VTGAVTSFQWAEVSAIAAAISATIALATTCVNLWSLHRTGRATDFNNCLTVVSQLAEAQRKVRDAKDDAARNFEFRELLNLMEALALMENDRRIASSTQKITERFLVESWAFLKSQPHIQQFLRDSMTDTDTFGELRRFEEKHVIEIRDKALLYERQQNPVNTESGG
jgi:hypothetical protein